jgi:hypothetical protein
VKSASACRERIVCVMTRKDQHAQVAYALARWENEGGSLASTGERENSKEEREIWYKQYARRVRAIALSRPRCRRRSHIQLSRPGCSIVLPGVEEARSPCPVDIKSSEPSKRSGACGRASPITSAA